MDGDCRLYVEAHIVPVDERGYPNAVVEECVVQENEE